jgi:hypothetical protein
MLQIIYDHARAIANFGKRKGWTASIAASIIALLQLATAIYLLSTDFSPSFLTKFSISHIEYIFLYGSLLVCGFWMRGWIGTAITLTTTLSIFLLALIAIRDHSVFLPGTAIGGLLPWSDANSYYIDALGLLDGFPLGWSARRPLFVGLLAALLKFTDSNLSVCILLLVVLNALGTFFLAHQVNLVHGPLAAAIVTIFSLVFYKNTAAGVSVGGIGTTLTENLGLALGNTSIAIIYTAISRSSIPLMMCGIFCLTLALCARAGAFFIVPFIVIAGAAIFKNSNKFNFKFLTMGIGASLGGLASNLLVGRLISKPSGQLFSNFSYTLYGLVVGGKGWTQVLTDHPQAREGTDIYELAFAHFRAYPSDLLKGMINMWTEYLPGHSYHAYQFIEPSNYNLITIYIQQISYLLCLIGLAWCFIHIKRGHGLVVLFAFTGHLLSIPFVPPIDAGLRVYAATICILFLLPAIGASWIVKFGHQLLLQRLTSYLKRQSSPQAHCHIEQGVNYLQVIFACVLVVMSTIIPIAIISTASAPSIPTIECQPNQEIIHFRYNPGSRIDIVSNSAALGNSRLPVIDQENIQADINMIQLKGDVESFTIGRSILTAYSIPNKRALWITLPSNLVPARKTVMSGCGTWSKDQLSKEIGLIHIDRAISNNPNQ